MARAARVVGVFAVLAGMVFTFGCGPEARVAPAPYTTTLRPGDRIETVTITLEVGDEGAALDEPVALDLGLGYPLWLHPLGREAGDRLPFGAVAQTSTAGSKIEPGGRATFTFGVAAAPVQDELLTTRHLLADTRVGDVRRIGFASARGSDWILGDYEVRINATVLHKDHVGAWKPDPEQVALESRLAEIERDLASLRTKYQALAAPSGADATRAKAIESQADSLLEERKQKTGQVRVDARSAGATRKVDEERLRVLQAISDVATTTTREKKETASTTDERTRLEARLAGTSPWYVADSFSPTWIPPAYAKTASVTIETRSHAGADTLNPVYFRAGGHKYALNGAYESLSATSGPQTFDLDLDAGPLASTDLSGWALGMLCAPLAQTTVPDRWHAQRLLVTVDGKVVYDSDDDSRDRRSLDAVRLIPPAHRDVDGEVVTNVETVREVFLWEAGQGPGLDSAGTSAAPLPASTDPTFPEPEDGLAADPSTGTGTTTSPNSSTSADAGASTVASTWPDPAFPPLPGEQGQTWSGGSGGWAQGGAAWGPPQQAGFTWGLGISVTWGSKSGGGGGGGGGGSGNSGNGGGGGSNKGNTTVTDKFQMKDVWISSGWKLNEPFTVEWKVSGATSGIRHFLVSLRVVRPDQSQGIFKHAAKKPVKVAVGQRSCVVLVDPAFQPTQPYYYLAPIVTAVTKKGGANVLPSHMRVGPARAVFPKFANALIQPFPKDFTWQAGGTGAASAPKAVGIGLAGKPQPPRAAWFRTNIATPDAIQIGIAKPASHVSVRPKAGDRVTLRYEIPSFKGRQLLVGHIGFMGATIASDKIDVEMECALLGSSKTFTYPVWKGSVATGTSLKFVKQMLVASALGVPMSTAEVRITFAGGGAIDPKCVPCVYGLRLINMANTVSTEPTVNADLEIDATTTWLVPAERRDGIYTGPARQLCVAIKNNGPDDIPATVLRDVKVVVKYYTGQYGDSFKAGTGDLVTCGPYRVTVLRELNTGGKWTGPLPKGGVMRLVPTPPANDPYLNPDGTLKGTRANKVFARNAHKLFVSWADILTQGAPALKESNPNNVWNHTYQPPLIIGKGPLDTEVLLFREPNFKGGKERYEYNPDTQRQRLIWDLRKEPGKQDMFWKTQSIMIGRDIDLVTADDHHFYSDRYNGPWWYQLRGGASSAVQPKLGRATGSMILCPKINGGPVGVSVVCEGAQFLGMSTEDPRSMFHPLPEDISVTSLSIKSLHKDFHNEVDQIRAWRTHDDGLVGPRAWVKVTLYEGTAGSGDKCTLAPPFWPRKWDDTSGKRALNLYGLWNRLWDGLVAGPGAVGVDDDVESFLMELKGASGY